MTGHYYSNHFYGEVVIPNRVCAGGCGRNITACNGFVKSGDFSEWIQSLRKAEDVRELCGLCSEKFDWTKEGTLKINPNICKYEVP